MSNQLTHEQIRSDILAAEGKRHIDGTYIPAIVLRSNETVHSLEPFQEFRTRFRGDFNTALIEHAAVYLAKHDPGDGLTGYVNRSDMSCLFVLDEGNIEQPGHCLHRVNIKAEQTPEFRALLNVAGKKLTQREMADWLEDYADYLDPRDATNCPIGYSIATAIQLIRKLTITEKSAKTHEAGDLKASRSALEEVEASSTQPLPSRISARFRAYEELDERSFSCRLVIYPEDEPKLSLRPVNLDLIQQSMAEEFAALIASKIAAADVIQGTWTNYLSK